MNISYYFCVYDVFFISIFSHFGDTAKKQYHK